MGFGQKYWHRLHVGPSELSSPGYSWRSASFASASYSIAVHWLGLYTSAEGLAIMTFLFVALTVLCEILEMKLDFTEPIAESLFHYLRIPDPSVSLAENDLTHDLQPAAVNNNGQKTVKQAKKAQ